MISVEAAKYLWDAQDAAQRAARFAAGRDFAAYENDELLRSGIERQLTIVGEALACLRRLDPALAATIPDLREIIAFRNILVHDYADIDNGLVWSVLERDLPDLLAVIGRLLAQAEAELGPPTPPRP
jgi:uncharacterized protein with HEPN domain